MKKRWTQELADFLRYCASERRLAPTTCSAYERDVSACLDYLQGQGLRDLAEVKVAHLRAFLAEEQKRWPAVSSQAPTTAALKSFFQALQEPFESLANRQGSAAARTAHFAKCICVSRVIRTGHRARFRYERDHGRHGAATTGGP